MAGRFSVEAVFKAVDRITAPISKMQNRVSKFTRSMRNGLRSVNRTVGKLAKGLTKGLKQGAVATTAVLTGLVVALDRVTSSADALAKQSRRLDFPIEDLQEWKFVAEQSGVSNELFDKSMGAFSKRLGEAKTGLGPLVSGLKKLNPELLKQIVASESVADAFDIYVKAIRASDSATEKAALANAAFSRSGLTLVNIADNSADAIEALKKQQRENGNITLKQAEAAEAYQDAMNALKRTIGGFIQSVLLPMVPLLTQLLKDFRAWALANKDIIATDILAFGRKVIDNFEDIVKWVKRIGIALAVFFTFVGILKTLVLVMTAVNLVMTANPIGLIIVAVGLLIAALVGLVFFWDEIKAAFLDTEFGQAVIGVIDAIVGTFAEMPGVVMDAWSGVTQFFSDMWSGILSIFDTALAKITGIMDTVGDALDFVSGAGSAAGAGVADFFGFGDDEDAQAASTSAQVVSPQARVARSIEEQRTTSTAEVTIRDETGRAEVTQGTLGPGLKLEQTGAF